MYSKHNEGKSVVAAANDSKSYLVYLNKLLDEHNNTYNPIGKNTC